MVLCYLSIRKVPDVPSLSRKKVPDVPSLSGKGIQYIFIYILSIIHQSQTRICPTWRLPAVLDSYRTTVQYRICWTVAKRGYGHSAHAVPTHQSSVNVLNENIINIYPFAENIDMFSHRLIFIVNNIFNIGWVTVQYRLYWTQISYIGLGCASSNIAFFVQYNLY